LDIAKLGIVANRFKVGGMEHFGTPQNITTVLYLEPYLTIEDYWIFPIVSFGTDTIFGW
jgi:hypothetical protein